MLVRDRGRVGLAKTEASDLPDRIAPIFGVSDPSQKIRRLTTDQ